MWARALKNINTCFITRLPNIVLNTVLSLALSVYELVDDVAKAYNGASLLARTAARYVYSPMLDGVVGGRHVGGMGSGAALALLRCHLLPTVSVGNIEYSLRMIIQYT